MNWSNRRSSRRKPADEEHHCAVSIYQDDVRPLDLDKVNTYPLAERPSKVAIADFARPFDNSSSLQDFLRSLPNILAARALR